MWLKCLQHQTAITVSNMTLHLGFLCPLFCCAKILQQGKHIADVKREVAKIVEENLEWTYGQSPDPNDIARTTALVEDCLLHPFSDRDEARNISVPLEVVARAICRLFNGDIRKRKIHHFCRAGCCMDRATRQSARVLLCFVMLLFPFFISEILILSTL